MTHNRLYNRCVIFALILIVGLGFALVLPWLANAQSLAAQYEVDTPIINEPHRHQNSFADSLQESEAIIPNPPSPICFATHDNGATSPFSSTNATAVQQAVDAASPGDTVKVAGYCAGVQTRAGLTQTVYISKRLTLEGGHTESDWTLEPDMDTYITTLNADKGGRVVMVTGTANVTLDSFYLVGGLADDGTLDDSGGGIWSNSEMTLRNSNIYSNTATIFGGGMYNRLISPVLTNVTFSGNLADSGGAMFNWGVYGFSSPALTNVAFSGNSAIRNGGAMYNYGYLGNSSPIFTNVTFSGNYAGKDGGAMYNYGEQGNSVVQVYNSILWNNTDSSGSSTIDATIYNNSAVIILTHSLAQGTGGSGSGTWPPSYVDGGGNIDTDPMFIIPIDPSTAPTTAGNLRLQSSSPAIDVGDNTYVAGILTDLDGEARIIDGNLDGTPTVDMGAYEVQIEEVYVPLIFR